MIDEKGKLFGKVNIIDIITLAIIVVLLTFGYRQFAKLTGKETKVLDNIEVEFYQEESNEFIPKNVKVGDIAIDSWSNAVLGTVKDIEIDSAVSWPIESFGKIEPSSRDGYNSVRIKMDTKGIYTDSGVNIDGKDFYVGETVRLKVGTTIFYGNISKLEKLEVENNEK